MGKWDLQMIWIIFVCWLPDKASCFFAMPSPELIFALTLGFFCTDVGSGWLRKCRACRPRTPTWSASLSSATPWRVPTCPHAAHVSGSGCETWCPITLLRLCGDQSFRAYVFKFQQDVVGKTPTDTHPNTMIRSCCFCNERHVMRCCSPQ